MISVQKKTPDLASSKFKVPKLNKRTQNERKGKHLMKSKQISHSFSLKANMIFSELYFQERFSAVNCVFYSATQTGTYQSH